MPAQSLEVNEGWTGGSHHDMMKDMERIMVTELRES